MDEKLTPVVYAGIIDEIGRRQYSGGTTWLREYIQNAIDGGAKTVHISFHGNDFEISDDGKGMNREILVKQAFSIGKSLKNAKAIGELGIGMYAGSGICDTILVRTKMKGDKAFLATLDMKKYKEIINSNSVATFEETMDEIFSVNENIRGEDPDSFTTIRFENLTDESINLIKNGNLKHFLEFTIDLPINENFKHKQEVLDFIGEYSYPINVTLEDNGTTTNVTKFDPGSIEFTDTFWKHDIIDDEGRIIGKIWAAYNKAGTNLDNDRVLVKRKGITVGDETFVKSKFGAKYSSRFFGEIILLDDRIEINTNRDWFVASTYLSTFVQKTKKLLNELEGIAEFDSKFGIRSISIITNDALLEERIQKHKEENNNGLKDDAERKLNNNKRILDNKIQEAIKFKNDVDAGKKDLDNPTVKIKAELIERTLNSPEVQNYLKNSPPPEKNLVKTARKQNWPQIVITFLRNKVIDNGLAGVITNGDIKDTTDRVFTYIEQTLKAKVGKKEQESSLWKSLITEFEARYNPPDLKGFSPDKYKEAFEDILNGMHTTLRNPSNHSFMKDMDNPRNILQVILIADFIVQELNRWTEK